MMGQMECKVAGREAFIQVFYLLQISASTWSTGSLWGPCHLLLQMGLQLTQHDLQRVYFTLLSPAHP